MTTIASNVASPWLDLLLSRTASVEAERAQDFVAQEVVKTVDRSIFLRERHRSIEELSGDVLVAARSPNWDGYGARAVEHQSIEYAHEFLSMLPADSPQPEVSVDPDGEVSLEWAAGPRSVFSVSVGRDGTLTYAGLFGYNKSHGVETLSTDLPMVILHGIRRATHRPSP